MPTQMPTQPVSTSSNLDPQLVNLAKSLRQVESAGNFQAQGKSGEYGAYQFMPTTWQATAPKYGVTVPLQQATPEQQNEVAYKQLAEWKQEHPDWNVGNFASAWNAGPGKPDAYQQNNIGTNSQGVQYDTPAYAKKVAEAYQQIKNQSSGGGYTPPTTDTQVQQSNAPNIGYTPPAPPTPVSTGDTSTTQPQESFVGDLSQGNYLGAAKTAASGLINTVLGAPESLGTRLGQLAAKGTATIASKTGLLGGQAEADKINARLQTPQTTLTGGTVQPLKSGLGGVGQIGGDALQTALLGIGPEIGAGKTILSRLGTNAALGAGLGIGNALSDGGNWNDVLKQAGVGAITGGVISGTGEILNKAAQYLPQRLARTFIPGLNSETAQYAVNRGLGAPSKMLEESDANLTKVGSALGTAVKEASGPEGEAQTIPGQQILEKVASQFSDAGMTAADIVTNLKKLIPLKQDLIDKIYSGQGTLEDLQRLNSSIGKATFKTVFDDPAVKAGKEIGNAVYHSFGNIIKGALGGKASLFDEYSKELQLNGALSKAVRRGEKSKPFTLRDIVALFAGSPGGPLGMASTYGLEKAATSPSINLKAAGLINKLNSPTIQTVGRYAKTPIIQGVKGVTNSLLPQ